MLPTVRRHGSRTKNSRSRGSIFGQQTAQHVEASRNRNCSNGIHASHHLRAGAGEVNINRPSLRIEAKLHSDSACGIRHAIVVQPILRAKYAARHASQRRAHQPLGIVKQLLGQRVQFVRTIFVHKLQDAHLPDAA